MKITLGSGNVKIEPATLLNTGTAALCFTVVPPEEARPVGTFADVTGPPCDESEVDVVIEFTSRLSAKLVREILDEMLAHWDPGKPCPEYPNSTPN